ncbi:stonustoxin subunit alpha-like [Megalobrama amblycephala]|uniref:stonustoxin subunit alpha-like n=1 Tax=Megalobrama amblycephala TaxID=75352 RepID=UPI002013EAB2|nr:stonustoxin subunit alpha-like [Megalobrama amblycephala]
MKFRVAVLLLLYKCLVFSTEPAASEPTCPLKTCSDVLKKLQDLEIRLAEIEELRRDKQDKDFVPKTRKDFLQYSQQITLDLNTMNKHLRLSENNTLIIRTDTLQSYPDHPDRFDGSSNCQVLCRESVSDRRSYWEVEWTGEYGWISVSYKSICRKGWIECMFGWNNQSWSLSFSSILGYSFRHNNIQTKLPVKPISSGIGVYGLAHYRIGVYVDHSGGTLSFYSVSGDTMILIHTVQTTFTEPLYPGFGFSLGSSVKLI